MEKILRRYVRDIAMRVDQLRPCAVDRMTGRGGTCGWNVRLQRGSDLPLLSPRESRRGGRGGRMWWGGVTRRARRAGGRRKERRPPRRSLKRVVDVVFLTETTRREGAARARAVRVQRMNTRHVDTKRGARPRRRRRRLGGSISVPGSRTGTSARRCVKLSPLGSPQPQDRVFSSHAPPQPNLLAACPAIRPGLQDA
ncbi:hypothetical protein FGB62_213g016 [Gracilaria domingensis]|nr:hypothetical protein FGB62_213g016 [Gracilaria domingensis]